MKEGFRGAGPSSRPVGVWGRGESLPWGGGERGDGGGHTALLEVVQAGTGKVREDVLGKEIALVEVGVTAEDEGADAHVHVAIEFGEDLVGISDNGAGAAAAGKADAAPEMGLDVEVLGLGAQFVLALDAGALAVLGTGFNLSAFGGIQFGDEPISGGAGFRFGLAYDDVTAEPEVDGATIGSGFFRHATHGFRDAFFGFRPHEKDVAVLRAEVLGGGGDATEVKEGSAVLLVGFGWLGGGEGDVVKLAVPFEGSVGAPEALKDLDDLAGAGVAGFVAFLLPGEV